jgi:uncharacterized membrane protein YkvA (DUF1232 family)
MAAGEPDPFPRERFAALLRRVPRYAQLAWRLGRDQRLPGTRRAALLAGAAYLVSPIDLVPGIIPVAGQLDDAAAILLALKLALAGLPAIERAEALAAASLRDADLDADLKTIGATYAWLGRRGARLAWQGTRALARAGGRLGGKVIDRFSGG